MTNRPFFLTAVTLAVALMGLPAGAATLSGSVVTSPGVGLAGVTITRGSNTAIATSKSGAFAFEGLSSGTYTVTPSLVGYAFTPSSRTVTMTGANAAGVDFRATSVTTVPLIGIPWSLALGQSVFHQGTVTGFFIGHSGSVAHIQTTSVFPAGIVFTGKIHLDAGSFTQVKGEALEPSQDHFSVVDARDIEFSFRTHRATDGLDFVISGGHYITFTLTAATTAPSKIVYGQKDLTAAASPVLFDLTR